MRTPYPGARAFSPRCAAATNSPYRLTESAVIEAFIRLQEPAGDVALGRVRIGGASNNAGQ